MIPPTTDPPPAPAVILPPAPAHPAPPPRAPHAVTGLWAPARSRRPEQAPPMIDEDDDDGDLAPWMRRPVGGAALGAGEGVGDRIVWTRDAAGDA